MNRRNFVVGALSTSTLLLGCKTKYLNATDKLWNAVTWHVDWGEVYNHVWLRWVYKEGQQNYAIVSGIHFNQYDAEKLDEVVKDCIQRIRVILIDDVRWGVITDADAMALLDIAEAKSENLYLE